MGGLMGITGRRTPRLKLSADECRGGFGIQGLPLSAAKPWFSALMVCQPIEGHHGATARCCTAVSGRRTSSLNLYDWRKPTPSVCDHLRPIGDQPLQRLRNLGDCRRIQMMDHVFRASAACGRHHNWRPLRCGQRCHKRAEPGKTIHIDHALTVR